MVRLFIVIIFSHSFFVCTSQVRSLDSKIELNASFSSDIVILQDSLEVVLTYRNTTNDNFNLYPEAIIGLAPNQKAFITYDKPAFAEITWAA